jgi:hypothetical protein
MITVRFRKSVPDAWVRPGSSEERNRQVRHDLPSVSDAAVGRWRVGDWTLDGIERDLARAPRRNAHMLRSVLVRSGASNRNITVPPTVCQFQYAHIKTWV